MPRDIFLLSPTSDPDYSGRPCTEHGDCGNSLYCLNKGICGSKPENCKSTTYCLMGQFCGVRNGGTVDYCSFDSYSDECQCVTELLAEPGSVPIY
jgi:hypothetical protein